MIIIGAYPLCWDRIALKTICCYYTLKTGTIIIGCLSIPSYTILAICSLLLFGSDHDDNDLIPSVPSNNWGDYGVPENPLRPPFNNPNNPIINPNNPLLPPFNNPNTPLLPPFNNLNNPIINPDNGMGADDTGNYTRLY